MGKLILDLVKFILMATSSFAVGAIGSSFGESWLYTIKFLFSKKFKEEEERKARLERLETERRLDYWKKRAEVLEKSENGETIAAMIAQDMLFEPDIAEEFVRKYPDKVLYTILEDDGLRREFVNVYMNEKEKMKKEAR